MQFLHAYMNLNFVCFVWRMLFWFHWINTRDCEKDYAHKFCWNVSGIVFSGNWLQVCCKSGYMFCRGSDLHQLFILIKFDLLLYELLFFSFTKMNYCLCIESSIHVSPITQFSSSDCNYACQDSSNDIYSDVCGGEGAYNIYKSQEGTNSNYFMIRSHVL